MVMKFNSHYRNIKTFEETNAMWHAYSKGVSKPWYATHVHAQDKEGERERERERERECVYSEANNVEKYSVQPQH